ncbi:MAG: CRISPR-associated helicase Cas3' [Eubacteriales bacterium]|nr:CRISPR-associated helicase Cas3' [Eubacteriales bacterium]
MQENGLKVFYAHYNAVLDKYQSNYDHNSETAAIAVEKNPIPYLENMVWIAGILHDCGKYSEDWQEYFKTVLQNPEQYCGHKEDHITAGGQLIEELEPGSLLSQIVQLVIYSHHGLRDCVTPNDSSSLYVRRREKARDLPYDQCRERFFLEHDRAEMIYRCMAAKEENKVLKHKIQDTMNAWGIPDLYGNRDFFLGMYVRLLLSLLIDADRRNTEDFMSGEGEHASIYTDEERSEIWKICIENLEKKIAGFKDKSGINAYRREISDMCRNEAEMQRNLYQLTVPTGAGKTLSSLRFAVNHANRFHKKRIIYVAPFHSIVEQNAEEIRKAIGLPEIVLEHHCNIVLEREEDQIHYDRITEDWISPIVVTTAVQFLDTLFAGKTGNIRRMQSLCNSIIIVDEVQALPIKVLELFNMAMNFLTEFMDTTVVLCTATQPLLDRLPQNRLRPPVSMIQNPEKYREAFRRTEILDCTGIKPGGMNVSEAVDFILEKVQMHKKVLFIANTKACARQVFERLQTLSGDDIEVTHLSTNMCPEHRNEVLGKVKESLRNREKMQICVSTQLIEAGVDISFQCVVRSLAGLDHIIQSAGRCNRHKECDVGYVYLVRMDSETENVSRLKEIWMSQEAILPVLTQYSRDPDSLDHRLDSAKAIHMYFEYYFSKCLNQMCFPVLVKGVTTSIVELLSDNGAFVPKNMKKQMLKQAFKTAGDQFEVIEETGKISVIVPYDGKAGEYLLQLENPSVPIRQKKQILRKLQRYTVSISQTEREKIGNGIYPVWEGRILGVEERFYDKGMGIVMEPKLMKTLLM